MSETQLQYSLSDIKTLEKFIEVNPDHSTLTQWRWRVHNRSSNGLCDSGAIVKRGGRWHVVELHRRGARKVVGVVGMGESRPSGIVAESVILAGVAPTLQCAHRHLRAQAGNALTVERQMKMSVDLCACDSRSGQRKGKPKLKPTANPVTISQLHSIECMG